MTVVIFGFFCFLLWGEISHFFAPRTLSKHFCVSKQRYYLPEYVVQTGENCLTPLPPTVKNNRKKRKKNFKMLIWWPQKIFKAIFLLKTYLGHIEVDDHSKTAKFFHSKYVFFAAKKKQVILWAQVILCEQDGYIKFNFEHFSRNFVEKSSP